MSSKIILTKRIPVDGQRSMVGNLELLSSQRTALRRCLEIHTFKGKNIVVSLYNLR